MNVSIGELRPLDIGDSGNQVGAIQTHTAPVLGKHRRYGIGRGRRISQVEGRSALRGIDAADLPAANDGIGHGIAAGQVVASGSKRQVIDQGGDIGDRQVVVRLAVVAVEVVAVLRVGRVGLERGGGVIQRVRPGKGVQQRQPGDKSLLVAGLQ